MDFAWESICNFGSLRERDCFLAWMRGQIADGVAEEIEAPAGFVLANDGSGIFLLARFGVSCRQRTHTGRASGLQMTKPHEPEAVLSRRPLHFDVTC